ncbi:transglutaminase [Methylopila jiangsuensis]|uniref:Transglutaminase n=1 Tax=Methylopila jiangsuensis TaxID=586230 RepID=A0A9W6JDP6_9HYPH|nr:transglutaminase family protein [Methylopila jiangsuensis]MDR6285341.1 transglutaminase-like putative cysteine protease [Methylopila jiangsuensis]GLK75097.1 transglutaminase [Methylopila jiangsuensis]
MKIRVGFEIVHHFPQPTPLLMMLNVHPSREKDLIRPDRIESYPYAPIAAYLDGFGNVCSRTLAPAGDFTLMTDALVADSGEPDVADWGAIQHRVEDLPDDVLVYLLPSRYCDADKLVAQAWSLFGAAPPGWAMVQTIVDFVHGHIRFGYAHASSTRSASEAFAEGRGVCRDFAHLAITLCRCMNIPARYATGYLGDIGVPRDPAPMDFSAWFEVYVGGRWRTFDARHNKPRIGRIVMARGRDAADAALTTAFGANTLKSFRVWTDEQFD